MKLLKAIILSAILLAFASNGFAEEVSLSLGVDGAVAPANISATLKVLIILTIISVGPGLLLMTSSFTRIVVVLSFMRQAMGTQSMPPNQVIIGLSLFLTFFIMAPVFSEIQTTALNPYIEGTLEQGEALKKGMEPLRNFMLEHTSENDLILMLELSNSEAVEDASNVPTTALIPAFMISELKRAFEISFLIYIPFLIVDMVVASILMGMGMMMLPPPIISLPFKLLLFVMVDGWHLVAESLVRGFTG